MRHIILIVFIVLGSVSFCYSLETGTHETVNEYIARNQLNGFSLDEYLREQLMIQAGVEEQVDYKGLLCYYICGIALLC